MTLSRMTALALALSLSGAAQAADTVTAEEATANYRKMFPPVDKLDCAPAKGDEVVVCGQRSGPSPRLPLPQDPMPGTRASDPIPSAGPLANRRDDCSTVGPNQHCSGGLPVAPAVMFLGKVIGKLLGGGD